MFSDCDPQEGQSKADGSYPQGGCEIGQFGYEEDDYSQPLVTAKDHRVHLFCTMRGGVAYGFAELRK